VIPHSSREIVKSFGPDVVSNMVETTSSAELLLFLYSLAIKYLSELKIRLISGSAKFMREVYMESHTFLNRLCIFLQCAPQINNGQIDNPLFV